MAVQTVSAQVRELERSLGNALLKHAGRGLLLTEGVTYQSLLDDAKTEMACRYLKNTALPMSAIAERLGFADDTNFSRSFRRWRQCTPMQYRKMS